MFDEDNNGFVNFPVESEKINTINNGSTLVYIICFEPVKNIKRKKSVNIDNINLFSPGVFVSDDVNDRPKMDIKLETLDNLIYENFIQNDYDSMYFPFNLSSDWRKSMSINLISAVCIGWSNQCFEYKDDIQFWNANFNDLTFEGKNLYYSLKKLHNRKEVRILTFNTN